MRAALAAALFATALTSAASAQYLNMEQRRAKQLEPLASAMAKRHADYAREIGLILDRVGIAPGMTVLDLGAGSGGYALECARRLKGRGEVVAADPDPAMTAFVAAAASRESLSSLRAVRISTGTADPLYARGRYDLILLFHTFSYLPEPSALMRTLRASLKPDGRLAILEIAGSKIFNLNDITDYAGLAKALASEPDGSPFVEFLPSDIKNSLRAYKAAGFPHVPAIIRSHLFKSLTWMHSGMRPYEHFLDPSTGEWTRAVKLLPAEALYVRRTLAYMKAEGTFSRQLEDFSPTDLALLLGFNKVMITQKFRPYLYDGGPAPYLPGSHPRFIRSWNSHDLRYRMLDFGYRLDTFSDEIPFEDLLIFSRNDAPKR